MNQDLEIEFISRIDCNFPYLDKGKCLSLIEESIRISSNSTFKVIEELCRIPAVDKRGVTNQYLLDLLNITSTKLDHPLQSMITQAAECMIMEQELTVDDAIQKMELVRPYRGQFAALSILYFSCDDKNQQLDPLWEDILSEWRKNGV